MIDYDDVNIDKNQFQSVLSAELNVHERKCDIFGKIKLSSACNELNLSKHEKLDKCSVIFYLEVDPPGQSIFKEILLPKAPNDGRRSWYNGDSYTGYTFSLNIGHPHYTIIKEQDIPNIRKLYEQEQMFTQGYYIAAENDCYKGPAEDFATDLKNQDISHIDASKDFDHILGKALKKLLEG